MLEESFCPSLVTSVVETWMAEINATEIGESAGVFTSDNNHRLEVKALLKPLVVSNLFDYCQTVPAKRRNVISVLRGENPKLCGSIANPRGTFYSVLSVSAINFRISSGKLRKISVKAGERFTRHAEAGLSATNLCN